MGCKCYQMLYLSLISQLSNENIVIFIRHNKTLKLIQISARLDMNIRVPKL